MNKSKRNAYEPAIGNSVSQPTRTRSRFYPIYVNNSGLELLITSLLILYNNAKNLELKVTAENRDKSNSHNKATKI